MAKCPKCKIKLPAYEIGTITKLDKPIRCENCKTFIEVADKKFFTSGAMAFSYFGAMLGLLGLRLAIDFENKNGWILFGLGLWTIIVTVIYQIENIPLKVSSKQDWDHYIPLEERPYKSPRTRMQYLINTHYKKTDAQLNEMINSKDYWTEEAKDAARELLRRREEEKN